MFEFRLQDVFKFNIHSVSNIARTLNYQSRIRLELDDKKCVGLFFLLIQDLCMHCIDKSFKLDRTVTLLYF